MEGLKKRLKDVRLRVEIANPLRSRSPSPSPSPSARNAASETASDRGVSRADSVPLHQNLQTEATGHGSPPLGSRPRESSETSSTRPRPIPPSPTVTPSTAINDGQAVEDREIPSLTENRRPRSPDQEWVSLHFHP